MTLIRFVRGEDWQGLYIDGLLALEGHILDAHDVLLALQKVSRFDLQSVTVNDAWMCEQGRLPVHFHKVWVVQEEGGKA